MFRSSQASNLTGFFEHLMAPGHALEHYSHSLHDLPVRAEALLAEWRRDPTRLWKAAGGRARVRTRSFVHACRHACMRLCMPAHGHRSDAIAMHVMTGAVEQAAEHARPALRSLLTEQRQGLAAAALNQVALAEAMAAAITQAASLSDWQPKLEPGYEPVPFSRCCGRAPALPAAFVEAVRATRPPARDGAEAGGGGGRVTVA